MSTKVSNITKYQLKVSTKC